MIVYAKYIGGNVGNQNLLISRKLTINDDFTWNCQDKYDGGKEADENGYYTHDSINAYLESKGKSKLKQIRNGNLS